MSPLYGADGPLSLVARKVEDDLPPLPFPNAGFRSLSTIVHLLGVSLLSYCIARRVDIDGVRSFVDLRKISLPRILLSIIFVDSWLFLFLGGVLVGGEGLGSIHACSLAIYTCIAFYVTTKLFIYWFLVERVHVVWSPISGKDRRNSRIYKVCIGAMSLYVACMIIVVVERVSKLRPDGKCIIGVRPVGTIPTMIYDLILNIFLVCMFIWPLWKANVTNVGLRYVARRTLVATLAALTSSIVNLMILTIMNGEQMGWICLASCGADVMFNALVLYWATGGIHESLDTTNTPDLPSIATRQSHAAGLGTVTGRIHYPHVDRDEAIFRGGVGPNTALSSTVVLSGVGVGVGGVGGVNTLGRGSVDMDGLDIEGVESGCEQEKEVELRVDSEKEGIQRRSSARRKMGCASCAGCTCQRSEEGESNDEEGEERWTRRKRSRGGVTRRSRTSLRDLFGGGSSPITPQEERGGVDGDEKEIPSTLSSKHSQNRTWSSDPATANFDFTISNDAPYPTQPPLSRHPSVRISPQYSTSLSSPLASTSASPSTSSIPTRPPASYRSRQSLIRRISASLGLTEPQTSSSQNVQHLDPTPLRPGPIKKSSLRSRAGDQTELDTCAEKGLMVEPGLLRGQGDGGRRRVCADESDNGATESVDDLSEAVEVSPETFPPSILRASDNSDSASTGLSKSESSLSRPGTGSETLYDHPAPRPDESRDPLPLP